MSVEAEIGSVGYSDPSVKAKQILTEPEEAARFAEATQVDALAIAIGTLHRMEEQAAVIDYERLDTIQRLTDVPLVIHGSTGLTDEDLAKLAVTQIAKINIGTAIRMAFGKSIRQQMENDKHVFDRIQLMRGAMPSVKEVIFDKYKLLGW